MLVIVDYGLGNLRSICSALERLDIPYQCTAEKYAIASASGLIIPGVGAFHDGIKNLGSLGLVPLLNERVLARRVPVLGICLGFQLMARQGFEFGRSDGLGWLDAEVVRLSPGSGHRVPHVGWNDSVPRRPCPLFAGIPPEALFYFTHSYHVRCLDEGDVVAISEHGHSFVAAVQRGHIFGTQFHPEKSQSGGLVVLKNFAAEVAARC
jgi:glutamine amidotransferase